MRHMPANSSRALLAAALLAALMAFVCAQFLTSAHTAKYGEGPHDHNGKACVLTLVSHSSDKAIATGAFVLAVFVAVWRAGSLAAQSEVAALAVRASRPRGPPSF